MDARALTKNTLVDTTCHLGPKGVAVVPPVVLSKLIMSISSAAVYSY